MRRAEHTVSDTSNISLIPAVERHAVLVAHPAHLVGSRPVHESRGGSSPQIRARRRHRPTVRAALRSNSSLPNSVTPPVNHPLFHSARREAPDESAGEAFSTSPVGASDFRGC